MTRAHEITELFRAAFAADTTNFSGVPCLADISSADNTTLPALIFQVTDTPVDMAGKVCDFTLTVHVEGSADISNALTAHNTLVEKVRTKLHGSGKSALITTLETGGTWSLNSGWSATPAQPSIASQHFRTPIALIGTITKI